MPDKAEAANICSEKLAKPLHCQDFAENSAARQDERCRSCGGELPAIDAQCDCAADYRRPLIWPALRRRVAEFPQRHNPHRP